MSCCYKRRKQKVELLLKRRLFEADAYSVIVRIKKKLSSSLQENILFSYHQKAHNIYDEATKLKLPNIKFINNVVEVHNLYATEILRREHEHDTPLKKRKYS